MSDYADQVDDLILPEPIGLQPEWLASPKPRKVLRVGRRGTKTRFALLAATVGHGDGKDGAKLLPGILEGGDVVWVAQDYPNLLRVAWKEELKPRFGHLSWATLSEQHHTVSIPKLGTLHLISAEAIDGIRGMGKNVRGIIVDEAAHLDLEGALLDVLLPVCLDNNGWLVLMSTTNAGPDGNSAKRVPSYFNLICEQIRAGQRSEDWVEFTGTAFDNPTISPQAIRELIEEYPPDSPKLKQEVFAELLVAGVGLALPKIDRAHHIVPRYAIPSHWTQFGALDWGFNHPWVFGWYAGDEDGNIVKVDTIWGREDLPDEIATTIRQSGAPITHARFVIHAGHDIFTHKGRAIGFKGPTIAEKLRLQGLKVIEASISRVLGLDNLRAYTDWADPSPEHPHGKTSRFTMMETAGNLRCLAQLQSMQIDPKDMEDALKIDADSAGRGGDDSYDETRYGLMSRPILAKAIHVQTLAQDRSLGYDYDKHQVKQRPSAEEEVAKIIDRALPQSPTVNRYRVPRR